MGERKPVTMNHRSGQCEATPWSHTRVPMTTETCTARHMWVGRGLEQIKKTVGQGCGEVGEACLFSLFILPGRKMTHDWPFR